MYAGIEARFLGPKDGDSHTILYFTLRQYMTIAQDPRALIPFPVKLERTEFCRQRQEANRQKGQAKGSPKGQDKIKGKVKGKSK